MTKQEKIQVTVPTNNAWHSDDLEEKAKKMGMSRSECALMAVHILMNFDDEIIQEIYKYARGLHVPAWLVMQNMIINQLAQNKVRAGAGEPRTLIEFRAYTDENGEPQTMTGKRLFRILVHELSNLGLLA